MRAYSFFPLYKLPVKVTLGKEIIFSNMQIKTSMASSKILKLVLRNIYYKTKT